MSRVETICGPFDRDRYKRLRLALQYAGNGEEYIMFEGQMLLVTFGNYLCEFLDAEFAKKGTEGL